MILQVPSLNLETLTESVWFSGAPCHHNMCSAIKWILRRGKLYVTSVKDIILVIILKIQWTLHYILASKWSHNKLFPEFAMSDNDSKEITENWKWKMLPSIILGPCYMYEFTKNMSAGTDGPTALITIEYGTNHIQTVPTVHIGYNAIGYSAKSDIVPNRI